MPSLPVRRALVLGWALFVFGGPFVRQVLGVQVPLFKHWRMYAGYASGQCVAEYAVRGLDGELVPVDRLKLLFGVDHWSELPMDQRRIDAKYVEHYGRRLCREAKLPDVRVNAKCATWMAWETTHTGEMNLCVQRSDR